MKNYSTNPVPISWKDSHKKHERLAYLKTEFWKWYEDGEPIPKQNAYTWKISED